MHQRICPAVHLPSATIAPVSRDPSVLGWDIGTYLHNGKGTMHAN